MTKKQKQRFYRELAKGSNKRVPNMLSMTFAELAALNESYIRRCLDEREAELALTSKR
jgi:hypothetical protein